jgi:apolipoprotein N-acyltransferase
MPALKRALPPLAAIASGTALSFCFPPWNAEWLVWAWMFPLLWVLWFTEPRASRKSGKSRPALRGAGLGFLAGLCFFALNFRWLYANELVPLPLSFFLQSFLALYFAAFGAFTATVGRLRDSELRAPMDRDAPFSSGVWQGSAENLRGAALNACAWAGLEWLRGWLFSGFGWNGLGVALHQNLILAQIADIVGVTGLSFLIMFVACIGIGTLRRFQLELTRRSGKRPHFDFAVAVLVLIGCFFYGLNRGRKYKGETVDINVLLIQGNVAQDEKWDVDLLDANYQRYDRLARLNLETRDFDLVVMPESAFPLSFYDGYDYHGPILDDLLALRDYTLLVGINEDALDEGLFNSIFAFRGSSHNFHSYRKIHLVPFGEYLPFRDTIPGWGKLVGDALRFDFSPGESTEPMKVEDPDFEIIPMVCFEDTLGRLTRKFITGNPQVMVNVTNDGWFGETEASAQHLANAVFRCIELRRPMVRAANTGITCAIDDFGSLADRSDGSGAERVLADPVDGSTFIEGTMPATLSLRKNPPITIYARVGDAFTLLAGAIALIATFRHCRRARK